MIKTILIDLGGVYFTRGTELAKNRFYKTINRPKKEIDELFDSRYGKEGALYRTGKMNEQEFWQTVINKLKVGKEMIPRLKEIWHSAYSPIPGMDQIVSELKDNYKIVACSGNVKERIDYLERKYNFMENFDDFIFSYEIGINKWDSKFYSRLVEEIKERPEECVYIDDYEEFIGFAKQYGFKTILFKNSEQLKSDLRKLGVRI